MAIVRFPVSNAIDPELYGGGSVIEGSRNKNVLYSKYSNGKLYATQRPSISLRDVAAGAGLPPKARGIVFWDKLDIIYTVLDDTVYQGGYSGDLAQKISSGRDPVYFFELGDYLILSDPENNEGWYIHSDDPTILLPLSDPDFPANIEGKFLAGGGTVLDGFLFLMTTDGHIYNSEINDPTSWNALDFIGTEREVDTGVFLTKQNDNIVAIGAKSVELFYNAGNPVASPLQRRSDISYRSGAIDRKAVFNTGERIYFVGSETTGTLGFYQIAGFQLTKISNSSIDFFLNNARARSKFDFCVTGGMVGEHSLAYITTLAPRVDEVFGDNWQPIQTIVYDGSYQVWTSVFETSIGSIEAFGAVQVTERGDTENKEGRIMFFSGDIGVYDNTELSEDSSGDPRYLEDGYLENQDDYILDIPGDLTSKIEMELVLPEQDFDMITNKFLHRFSVVGTTIAPGSQNDPLWVSWSDDHYRSFSNPRPLCTGFRRSLTRLGKFKRRAFKLRYDGPDILRIEEIEYDVRASRYA